MGLRISDSHLIRRLSHNDGLFLLLGQSWATRLHTPPETVGNLYHEEQKDQLHRDDSSQSIESSSRMTFIDMKKPLTGIRTVLMPRSEIHTQSSSVIHVSQCLSRICLAFMPRAMSRSLCAG